MVSVAILLFTSVELGCAQTRVGVIPVSVPIAEDRVVTRSV